MALSVCFIWYAPAFSALVLDVYPRVTPPGHLVLSVAGPLLARFSKIAITNPAQIAEASICRIALHPCKDIFNWAHAEMVSLMVLLSR